MFQVFHYLLRSWVKGIDTLFLTPKHKIPPLGVIQISCEPSLTSADGTIFYQRRWYLQLPQKLLLPEVFPKCCALAQSRAKNWTCNQGYLFMMSHVRKSGRVQYNNRVPGPRKMCIFQSVINDENANLRVYP